MNDTPNCECQKSDSDESRRSAPVVRGVQPKRSLSWSDTVADGPDDYYRRDKVKKGEQQAAIEGGRGP
jgi:hypothetical protein